MVQVEGRKEVGVGGGGGRVWTYHGFPSKEDGAVSTHFQNWVLIPATSGVDSVESVDTRNGVLI